MGSTSHQRSGKKSEHRTHSSMRNDDIPVVSVAEFALFAAITVWNLLKQISFFKLLELGILAIIHTLIHLPIELISIFYREVKDHRLNILRKVFSSTSETNSKDSLPNSFSSSSTTSPTILQRAAISMMRLAFTHFPLDVGQVFFSEPNLRDFIHKRLSRHSSLKKNPNNDNSDHHDLCRKVETDQFKGYWIGDSATHDPSTSKFVIFCIHGGGFALGSAMLYAEFLYFLQRELEHQIGQAGSVCVFAVDYDLVPHARFPTQNQQVYHAYQYLLSCSSSSNSFEESAQKIMVVGDSAGGCLSMSLLLSLARPDKRFFSESDSTTGLSLRPLPRPKGVVLISPWTSLLSESKSMMTDSNEDYLDRFTLIHFASMYAGSTQIPKRRCGSSYMSLLLSQGETDSKSEAENLRKIIEPYLSPLECTDSDWFREAMPEKVLIMYGTKEVLKDDCILLAKKMKESGGVVDLQICENNSVHVWPILYLYLGRNAEERKSGIRSIADFILQSE